MAGIWNELLQHPSESEGSTITASTDKREVALIKKYGSKKALLAKRREWQKKSRKNLDPTKHGFGLMKLKNPEKLKEISREARKKQINSQ